ncbi:entry-fusion complex essential component (Cop-H2R) [Adoxophyes honmai entomopoxvirus 'L']|uniref:Entry-fusion complex essential component (Cop-H2R) n=1 Tax=Adoxophyes honmai entomopoxvirus 'L' TaxID=1293540 RepID=A0A916P6A5_9POXV|nr:entry-fusion complex essential component (Cop-H2R) [Adoxophyes honmai entomopoxvirus 'L']CCU55515.1 entry-fusion complex essential component (Cop-H2R) [Adoxophyes honmai entomopoxvirus 'L']
MNNTILQIGEKNIDYYRSANAKLRSYKGYMAYILSIIFIIISTIFFILQSFRWEPLVQLDIFRRIKKNIGSWKQLVLEKTQIEMTRGRARSLQLVNDAFDYKCYDFGNYYAALRLNQNTFLPEFILRGIGDVWRFRKSAETDIPALQFCEYTIFNNTNNAVQCGIDMFNKLGYSGYFENQHPCQYALNILSSNNY